MAQQSDVPPQLIADYQATIELIKLLTDIRFRLLALVPSASVVAVGFLGHLPEIAVALPVGILGFAVTLGIIMYDLRNSQIYNLAMHRAKWLEYLLNMPQLTSDVWQKHDKEDVYHGGLTKERPFRLHWMFGKELLLAKHDRALALVYGASLGGWTYLVVSSLLSAVFFIFIDITKSFGAQVIILLISILVAAVVSRIFVRELVRVDGLKNPEKPFPKELQENSNAIALPNPPPLDSAELSTLKRKYPEAKPSVDAPLAPNHGL